jgi:hypothetical protein
MLLLRRYDRFKVKLLFWNGGEGDGKRQFIVYKYWGE